MNDTRTKRCYAHDYHEPCIYLVTVTVEGRRPLLGEVVGDASKAWIRLSDEGRAVWREIEAIPQRYPQVKVLQHQIMPDHVHLVLRVMERLPERLPLGNVVASWKAACSKATAALRDLKAAPPDNPSHLRDPKAVPHDNPTPYGMPGTPGLSGGEVLWPPQGLGHLREQAPPKCPPLFSKGFNDSILTGQGQLNHMMAYVRDNPRRLLIKRQHSAFFAIRRGLAIAGMSFDAVGNLDLLRRPLLAVHCRRRWSDEERRTYHDHCLQAAEGGAVLVGAFISPAEHAIAQAIRDKGLPFIHLVENGFNDLYKPVGEAFYATAEGRLLQLAPWPYHNDSRTITREQCLELNQMAEQITNIQTR